jgi:hypothetical protein
MTGWLRPNAPRFHALLQHHSGRRVFMMLRSTWESLQVQAGQPVLLTTADLAETPLATPPAFLFGEARVTPERIEVSIYRADLSDEPCLINVDTYQVWDDLPARVNVTAMVEAATTSTGANLDEYLDRVFLVSEPAAEGHHLPAVPDEIVVRLRRIGAGRPTRG